MWSPMAPLLRLAWVDSATLPSRISGPSWMRTISCKSYSPPSLRSKPFHNSQRSTPLTGSITSHKRIREMEHEFFQSELKPSVDDNLLSKIIRSTSSGENSHRTAAMELIFERSILERREKAVVRVRDSLQPEPVPEPRRSREGSRISAQPAEPLAPAPTPPPVSRPPPKPRLAPSETAPNPKPMPRPESSQKAIPVATRIDADAHLEPAPNMRAIDSKPPVETFLRCSIPTCGASLSRNGLEDGLYCGVCSNQTAMRCGNCGVQRSKRVKKCGGCGLPFVR